VLYILVVGSWHLVVSKGQDVGKREGVKRKRVWVEVNEIATICFQQISQ
jgi:hypothetical protein